ncbi:ABC transporter substrate-binding protein [Streptomyces sp. 8N616]|uniref:ABC transporter substrate-binding protein n=1 Tax=Streptomyces sp. 8N616 TaxID=3457414 RepID=UPI003FD0F0DF
MIDPHAARAAALPCFVALSVLTLTACGTATPVVSSEDVKTASSAEDAGGMDALVAAAQKEGTLNAIALPRDWANYGALIDGFTNKYGIEVKVAQPDGTSQDELEAVKLYKGQEDAPDVLDVGRSFAQSAAEQDLLAPYKVAGYSKIPQVQKDPLARWYNNYGGYISIGCDAAQVDVCPQNFADLLKPEYSGKVALNGDPTEAGSAFAGVYAAALANEGSLDDIEPGLDFFAELKKAGNFNPVQSTPATVETGETPITVDWDYLNTSYADTFRDKNMDWQVNVPTDGLYAEYYSLAINKDAPHPAAARLWQEYIFSEEGQNLRLEGYARPVLMDAMKENGTLHEIAAAWLPAVQGAPRFPTEEQTTKAKEVVAAGWEKAVGDD